MNHSRRLSVLVQFLRRRGAMKFATGWIYLLSISYVVVFQLRVSSFAPHTLVWMTPSSNSTSSNAPVSSEASTRKASGLRSWLAVSSGNDANGARSLHISSIQASYVDSSDQQPKDIEAKHGMFVSSSLPMMNASLSQKSNSNSATMTTRIQTVVASNHSQQRRKPILYLYAGPYKTATSFLQCVMSRNAYDILKSDGVFYLGTCAFQCRRAKYDFCEMHKHNSFFLPSGELQPAFINKVNELFNAGQKDALIVWEYLSDLKTSKIHTLISAFQGWEIRILLNYRRLYEWLPSWYTQKHRPMNGRERYNAWPGQHVILTRSEVARETGAHRWPFDLYSAEERRRMGLDSQYRASLDLIENTTLHPVELARRHWEQISGISNVTIISLHHLPEPDSETNDPLLHHLFCHVMRAASTCRAVRKNRLEIMEEGSNERFKENYDLLSIYAHENGLHPGGIASMTRPEMWRLIRHHQEEILNKSSTDFPLKCISNSSLELLWKLSVTAERPILTGTEEEHRKEFDRAVQNKEFCYIDVKKTLQHPDWRDFFQPFTTVLPHVALRDAKGHWTPSWDGQRRSILEQYFSVRLQHREVDVPTVELVGVIHASQTATVRLAEFLRNRTVTGSASLSQRGPVSGGAVGTAEPLAGCIFGPQRPSMSDGRGQRPCPLSRYASLVESWAKSLDRLADSSTPAGSVPLSNSNEESSSAQLIRVSFTPVTFVRDPLERWVSFYREWRNASHEYRRQLGDLALQERLNDGATLEEFLQYVSDLAYQSRSLLTLEQYQHVAADPRRAIGAVTGGTPRVLVLIQECWDASLHLLASRFAFVTAGTDDDGVTESMGDEAASSESTFGDADTDSEAHVGEEVGEDLRRKARRWFAGDYHYYDASVERFHQLLAVSSVPASSIDRCRKRLLATNS